MNDAPDNARAAALAYLSGIVTDAAASPSARQRAAEAILRHEDAQATGAARDAPAHTLTDAELLAVARGGQGEGGYPPKRGPQARGAAAGSIGEEENPSPTAPPPAPLPMGGAAPTPGSEPFDITSPPRPPKVPRETPKAKRGRPKVMRTPETEALLAKRRRGRPPKGTKKESPNLTAPPPPATFNPWD